MTTFPKCCAKCRQPDPLNLHLLGCGDEEPPRLLEKAGYQPSLLVRDIVAVWASNPSAARILIMTVTADAAAQGLAIEQHDAVGWVFDRIHEG
jgi:hypothetical protein